MQYTVITVRMKGIRLNAERSDAMTNREFFLTYCVKQDLCAIYRYAMWELKLKFENKPIWEKNEIYEKWLNQPLDVQKWNEARSHVKE